MVEKIKLQETTARELLTQKNVSKFNLESWYLSRLKRNGKVERSHSHSWTRKTLELCQPFYAWFHNDVQQRCVSSIILAREVRIIGSEGERKINRYVHLCHHEVRHCSIPRASYWNRRNISCDRLGTTLSLCNASSIQIFINIMDRFLCQGGGETRLHRRFALSKCVPFKNKAVAVWWAPFKQTENTRHAFFLKVQSFAIKVCRQYWTAKDVRSTEPIRSKRHVSQDQYLCWASVLPLKIRKGGNNWMF